jgi:hypothetical protein
MFGKRRALAQARTAWSADTLIHLLWCLCCDNDRKLSTVEYSSIEMMSIRTVTRLIRCGPPWTSILFSGTEADLSNNF